MLVLNITKLYIFECTYFDILRNWNEIIILKKFTIFSTNYFRESWDRKAM